MTHEERREIDEYILILKKNTEWMIRNISNLQEAVKKMESASKDKGEEDNDA